MQRDGCRGLVNDRLYDELTWFCNRAAACAAIWCSPCLTARFFDQYVRPKTYWIVLGVLGGLCLLQVSDLWKCLMMVIDRCVIV